MHSRGLGPFPRRAGAPALPPHLRGRFRYRREFSTRKAARARAIALYAQHSPKWKARAGR